MVKSITDIAEAKAVIERAKILPSHELRLRRQALIRMTHSSTAIEGNQLDANEVEALILNKKIDAPKRDIYEVRNYLNALKYIEIVIRKNAPISEKVLLRIHKLVTAETLPSEQSGHYRKGPVYIVRRRFGIPNEVVYTGPDAKKVPALCQDLLRWIEFSQKDEINPVIAAGIVHQEIAAIHPFADGNGRTARAFATLLLYKRGYDFRRLFALEDYYNHDLQAYYRAINIGETYEKRRVDFTPWLEYFVRGFLDEIKQVKVKILSLSNKITHKNIHSQIYLPKEQMDILDFLDQMGKITIQDAIDILKCPKRTVQLHLQKLVKIGAIKKIGKGPSSAYIAK